MRTTEAYSCSQVPRKLPSGANTWYQHKATRPTAAMLEQRAVSTDVLPFWVRLNQNNIVSRSLLILPVIILATVDEGTFTLALVHVEVGQDDLVHDLSRKQRQRRSGTVAHCCLAFSRTLQTIAGLATNCCPIVPNCLTEQYTKPVLHGCQVRNERRRQHTYCYLLFSHHQPRLAHLWESVETGSLYAWGSAPKGRHAYLMSMSRPRFPSPVRATW